MKKILMLALCVTSFSSVSAEENPVTQDEFVWSPLTVETSYTPGAFNRVLRKISTIVKVTNTTDATLENDVYRYIFHGSNLEPETYTCSGDTAPVEVDTETGNKFIYIPLTNTLPDESVTCQVNFELSRARLSFDSEVQEGTWIEP